MSCGGLGPEARQFVIYRIVGNDLPPRHRAGDSIKIAQKIIETESDFDNCEKRWLLNKLADRETEQRLHDLITRHGYRCDRVPFDESSYSQAFLKPDLLPEEYRPFVEAADMNNHQSWSEWSITGRVKSRQLKKMIESRPLLPFPMHGLAKEWIIREKSQTVVGINQARNRALELGFDNHAQWVLPLDGWSYFSDDGWASFIEAASLNSNVRYVSIPIVRSAMKHLAARVMGQSRKRDAEPQIAVHRMATQRFDERLRYGHCNKSELLWRIGVAGYRLKTAPWEKLELKQIVRNELTVSGGRIRRTPNRIGNRIALDMKLRWHSRFEGVMALCLDIDTTLLQRRVSACRRQRNSAFATARQPPPDRVKRVDDLLVNLAEQYVHQVPTGVTDKLTCPPGGELANYFSAPKYWSIADGSYKRRDGEPVLESTIGSAESRKFDRTSLDECIRRANVLTIAGILNERSEFLNQAALNLRHWFIDPATRTLPTARFAQYHSHIHETKDQRDPVNPAGLIDFRDIWTLTYIVPQLHRDSALTDGELQQIRLWCAAFFADLVNSKQGRSAYGAANNIGTFTHLLLLSLALLSQNCRDAAQLLNALPLRLCAQTDGIGHQPAESARTRPLHYSLFNAAAWVCVATLSRGAGSDLWTYADSDNRSICRVLHACASEREKFSDYLDCPQEFDRRIERLLRLVPANAHDSGLLADIKRCDSSCWQNHPDEGLPPLWPHFLPDTECLLG